MSAEDFAHEAAIRGFERRERDTEATSKGCFDNCFGGSSSRKPKMDSVPEHGEEEFQFRPPTQLQSAEPIHIMDSPMTPRGSAAHSTHLQTSVDVTPLQTPPPTPKLCYRVDEDGDIVSDDRGKHVLRRMHELTWIYFVDDILKDWRLQPKEAKEALLERLHTEFPNPEGHRFNNKAMLKHIGHTLKSRRSLLRIAVDHGDRKPAGMSDNDWRNAKNERRTFPKKWEQQREANRIQQTSTGINKLGSGGKAHFIAKFVSN